MAILVRTCCCGCDLRTGILLIGFLGVVSKHQFNFHYYSNSVGQQCSFSLTLSSSFAYAPVWFSRDHSLNFNWNKCYVFRWIISYFFHLCECYSLRQFYLTGRYRYAGKGQQLRFNLTDLKIDILDEYNACGDPFAKIRLTDQSNRFNLCLALFDWTDILQRHPVWMEFNRAVISGS